MNSLLSAHKSRFGRGVHTCTAHNYKGEGLAAWYTSCYRA
jgi:hypothetical protein